jgi:hypothetical protein
MNTYSCLCVIPEKNAINRHSCVKVEAITDREAARKVCLQENWKACKIQTGQNNGLYMFDRYSRNGRKLN